MSDAVREIGDKYPMAVALCSRCQPRGNDDLIARPQYCRVLDFMGDQRAPTLCLACWTIVKEAIRGEIAFGSERDARAAAARSSP